MSNLPKDMAKIISFLVGESVYKLNKSKLMTSMNNLQNISILSTKYRSDYVARTQSFTVSRLKYVGGDGLSMTVTREGVEKSTRAAFNRQNVKQLIKILLSMHGIKGKVVVKGQSPKFKVSVSNISRSDYNEVYYPMVSMMDNTNLSSYFSLNKFNSLTKDLIDPKWNDKLVKAIEG